MGARFLLRGRLPICFHNALKGRLFHPGGDERRRFPVPRVNYWLGLVAQMHNASGGSLRGATLSWATRSAELLPLPDGFELLSSKSTKRNSLEHQNLDTFNLSASTSGLILGSKYKPSGVSQVSEFA